MGSGEQKESTNMKALGTYLGNAACGRAAVTATCSDVPLEAAAGNLKPLQVKGKLAAPPHVPCRPAWDQNAV